MRPRPRTARSRSWTPSYGAATPLVGAFFEDLDRLPPILVRGRQGDGAAQLRFPVEHARTTLAQFAAGRLELAESSSDHAAEVRAKAARLREYVDDEALKRLRLRADLWVTAFYWPPYAPQLTAREYRAYVSHASERRVLPLRVAQETVEEAVREVRPFHWELEFPEVFFDSDGARRGRRGLRRNPWQSSVGGHWIQGRRVLHTVRAGVGVRHYQDGEADAGGCCPLDRYDKEAFARENARLVEDAG